MSAVQPVPQTVAEAVERYVEAELDAADKYENRTPLDGSGVYALHRLVAEAYGAGFEAGHGVASVEQRGRRARERS